MMFSMQEPYYGILLSSMNRIAEPHMATMGVGMSGQAINLYYNPDFVKWLPENVCMAALKHECLHVAFNHLTMFDNKPNSESEHQKRNIAMDLEVNCYVNKSDLDNEYVHAYFPENLGFERELGTMEYYRKLPVHDSQEFQNKFMSKPCNGGNGGIDGQFDDHDKWPKDLTDAERAVIEQAVEDIVVQAAEIVEKSYGTIPGEMKIRVDAIRKRKVKPAADWKRYVRRYIGNEFTEFIRKSKKRESRRFPDAPGNKHRRKSHILVAVDTSGSVSKREYEEFFLQIRTLQQHATFRVVECDVEITREFDYSGKMPDTIFGGGGTSFQAPVDKFIANRKKYDALIYFTDGYAPVPDNTPKDTLWVICSTGNKDKQEFRKNGASVVYIPEMKDAS